MLFTGTTKSSENRHKQKQSNNSWKHKIDTANLTQLQLFQTLTKSPEIQLLNHNSNATRLNLYSILPLQQKYKNQKLGLYSYLS